MQLLLISSSKVGDSGYLEDARPQLTRFFSGADNILFVPYAGVSITWDDYTQKVQDALPDLAITGLHNCAEPVSAIHNAEGILVGGGNTFQLLDTLYQHELIDAIKARVQSGTRYAGWSAGANIAGRSIRTTNDMPIVQPPSFDALKLVPFQINPHYTDYQPPGHNGETREDRLREFMAVAPDMPVVGIPEGVAIRRDNQVLTIEGQLGAYLFKDQDKVTYPHQADLSYLLELE